MVCGTQPQLSLEAMKMTYLAFNGERKGMKDKEKNEQNALFQRREIAVHCQKGSIFSL